MLFKKNTDTAHNNCDGNGCYSSADCTVQVKVGRGRTISLCLCETCKKKLEHYSNTDLMIQKTGGVSID
jgi:hypothetical protein